MTATLFLDAGDLLSCIALAAQCGAALAWTFVGIACVSGLLLRLAEEAPRATALAAERADRAVGRMRRRRRSLSARKTQGTGVVPAPSGHGRGDEPAGTDRLL